MNVVFIFATVCLLKPVFGRAVHQEPLAVTPENLANKTFKACGSRLNDLYKYVCERVKDSSGNMLRILGRVGRFKRGVVDDCCHRSCTLEEFSEYCPGKSNLTQILENNLRLTTQSPKGALSTPTELPTNEVRKKSRAKGRKNGRRRRQPIVMPCMYRSYAHFLLRERRRLQGKLVKRERIIPDEQHGTTGPIRLCETCSSPQYKT